MLFATVPVANKRPEGGRGERAATPREDSAVREGPQGAPRGPQGATRRPLPEPSQRVPGLLGYDLPVVLGQETLDAGH
jgi:hypothetical protein